MQLHCVSGVGYGSFLNLDISYHHCLLSDWEWFFITSSRWCYLTGISYVVCMWGVYMSISTHRQVGGTVAIKTARARSPAPIRSQPKKTEAAPAPTKSWLPGTTADYVFQLQWEHWQFLFISLIFLHVKLIFCLMRSQYFASHCSATQEKALPEALHHACWYQNPTKAEERTRKGGQWWVFILPLDELKEK